MEQGLVEHKHRETQKIMGLLVKDVTQCFPNETGELLHVVEFIVYNTPGPTWLLAARYRQTMVSVDPFRKRAPAVHGS